MNDNDIQEILKLIGKPGHSEQLHKIKEVKMALKIMYDTYVSGYYIDDNPYPREPRGGYQPFIITTVSQNDNVIVLKIRDISIILDCYTKPEEILWRQPGKETVSLDLRHLLYRISKLRFGESNNNLINCILIGINIYRQLSNEVSEFFVIGGLSTPGISIVQIILKSISNDIKYSISVQFSKITVWNKNLDKCVLETYKPEDVVDRLLIEALS